MTDERREEIRRADDQIVSDRLDAHIQHVDAHIDDFNEFRQTFTDGSFVLPGGRSAVEVVGDHDRILAEQRETREAVSSVKQNIDELASELLGTPASNLRGGGREADGLIHRFDRVERRLTNGGVMTRRQKWLLGIAALGPLATVVAAWILVVG